MCWAYWVLGEPEISVSSVRGHSKEYIRTFKDARECLAKPIMKGWRRKETYGGFESLTFIWDEGAVQEACPLPSSFPPQTYTNFAKFSLQSLKQDTIILLRPNLKVTYSEIENISSYWMERRSKNRIKESCFLPTNKMFTYERVDQKLNQSVTQVIHPQVSLEVEFSLTLGVHLHVQSVEPRNKEALLWDASSLLALSSSHLMLTGHYKIHFTSGFRN